MLDTQLQLACSYRSQHIVCALLELLASDNVMSHTRTRKKERAFLGKKKRVELWHGATGAAKEHHISSWPEHVQALFKGCLADRVIHHVDAFVIGDLLCLRLKVSFCVKNHMIRASLSRQIGLCFRGNRPDHARANLVRHLHQQQSHTSGCGMD